MNSVEVVEPTEVPEPIPIIETSDNDNTNAAPTPVLASNGFTNGHSSTNGHHANGHATPSYIDSMAHLSVIRDDSDAASVRSNSSRASRRPQMQLSNYQDEFTTSVYGSRFAGMDLPRHHMPECEMPRDIAYRMIKDDLSLDNNPMLKYVVALSENLRIQLTDFFLLSSLASFVTTYMVRP